MKTAAILAVWSALILTALTPAQEYENENMAREGKADADNPVVIGAETTVRWKCVVAAMDAAVRAGFKNVQFAVSFRAGSISG